MVAVAAMHAGCSHKPKSPPLARKTDPDAELIMFAKKASEEKRGGLLGIGGQPKPTTTPARYEAPGLVIMGRTSQTTNAPSD